LRTYSDMPKEGPVTPEQARQLRHGYQACISFVDAQIGRLLGELDRLRLRDNTIVVVWGDHGFHLGDYGIWCKNTNFEVSTRAPLIVSMPGGAAGRTAALVELVDIYPSLCELAGLRAPSFLEGKSFVPLLTDPAKPWKTAAFSQYLRRLPEPAGDLMGYTMRTDRFRLTLWHPPKAPNDVHAVELYNHRLDPGETVNIASRPENAALVKQLTLQLRRGWREVRSAL
jgi:arylsulfatase A-like enzyme